MSGASKVSNCPHVLAVGCNTWDDVYRKKQTVNACEQCGASGPNLWLCLHSRCLFVGCGESASDHSTAHSEVRGQIKTEKHSLTLNMTTMRIWCYECECEVYKDNNNPPLLMRERSLSLTPLNEEAPMSPSRGSASHHHTPQHSYPANLTPDQSMADSDSDDDDEAATDKFKKPRGLTGLSNIGNTCYLNAALQALSNCPPLTRFFLDCPSYIHVALANQQPGPRLARSYLKLVQDMWNRKRRSYLVPSTVAQGIKNIHPMFRGYTQQDTQEFLRCFMDQLHEELKMPVPELNPPKDDQNDSSNPVQSLLGAGDGSSGTDSVCAVNESSESSDESPAPSSGSGATLVNEEESEYETCDSSERGSVNLSQSMEEPSPQKQENKLRNNTNMKNSPSSSSASSSSSPRPKSLVSVDTDSGISSSTSLSSLQDNNRNGISPNPKNYKDTANQKQKKNKQQNSNTGGLNEIHIMPVCEKLAEMEGSRTEHAEETEPLQGQQQQKSRTPSRSRSSSQKVTENEGKVVQQKSPPTSIPSHKVTPQPAKKKKVQIQYASVISDIFDGKILSSVQCLTCERVSSTKEAFQDLSLPIPSKDHLHMIHHTPPTPSSSSSSQNSSSGGSPGGAGAGAVGYKGGTCGEVALKQGWMTWITDWMKSWFWGPKVTLNDCLSAFFSQDELKGDNMYSCEKCKKLRNGVKYSKVLELPEIICIHLKRFRHELMYSSKINSYVEFPMEGLDMRPYLHKDCQDQVTQYDLTGVICHHGTAGGGHYTAYALNYINERWYEFDDQYVTEVDMPQVESCEAYVLFYRKKNDDMMTPRLQAKQILESPDYSDSFMKFYISRQWINRFNSFAEPGPITNRDFLCRHGGVHPHRWSMVDDLAEMVPQKLWAYLHDKFGGGPAVNHLYQCDTCQTEIDRLKRRQRVEMETFVELHELFKNEESPVAIYGISMSWFKEWENFVKARTDEPPGPIDNQKIAITKNGVSVIRQNSDHGQLSESMWRFLLDLYGGGPELVLKTAPPPPPTPAVTMTPGGASSQGDGNNMAAGDNEIRA